jgi:hypothetical protein
MNSTVRIVDDRLRERSLRETYWAFRQSADRIARLARPSNRSFARVVARDLTDFLVGVRPVTGEEDARAEAAVEWLLRAQEKTGCRGVSLGFFPCDSGPSWFPPYPETTGYIITSLLRYASRKGDDVVRQRALEMAAWEVEIQMPNGAVQGGPFVPGAGQTPCAFNTGMVLDGWCSAFETTKDHVYLDAGRRAADYLVNDLTADGYFCTNGQFVKPDLIKTYNCLCAWSMYRVGELLPDPKYKLHAVRVVDAVLRQQQPNGWFDNNCLTRPEAPLLHTIAYTLDCFPAARILLRRYTAELSRLFLRYLQKASYPAGITRIGNRPASLPVSPAQLNLPSYATGSLNTRMPATIVWWRTAW